MKKLDFIYNPRSGDKKITSNLDNCIECFQNAGYSVSVYRTQCEEETLRHIEKISGDEEIETIVAAGGDGTINMVLNAMLRFNVKASLGIIPSGTANDFARHLKIPTDISKCCDIICNNEAKEIDLGKANDKYFINVCAGGLFTNVSQNIDTNLKNTLGKLAYYLKGIEQIPSFSPIPLKIETQDTSYEDDFYLFMVFNGGGAGGFDLVPNADITDGLLEFIGIKVRPIVDLAKTFFKLLQGDLTKDENVVYFQGAYFKITPKEESSIFNETDVDGEAGPSMPVEISVVPRAIKLYF